MPLNQTLMDELRRKYGAKKAEDVYWGMVGEGKGPFAPGGKYRAEHEAWASRNGVQPTSTGKRKGPPPKKRASRRG